MPNEGISRRWSETRRRRQHNGGAAGQYRSVIPNGAPVEVDPTASDSAFGSCDWSRAHATARLIAIRCRSASFP
jgi:hypothetical protein